MRGTHKTRCDATGTSKFDENSFIGCEKTSRKRDEETPLIPLKKGRQMSIKAFKYRISANKATTNKLQWVLDRARELYNAALTERRDAYEMHVKRHPGYYDEGIWQRFQQNWAICQNPMGLILQGGELQISNRLCLIRLPAMVGSSIVYKLPALCAGSQ